MDYREENAALIYIITPNTDGLFTPTAVKISGISYTGGATFDVKISSSEGDKDVFLAEGVTSGNNVSYSLSGKDLRGTITLTIYVYKVNSRPLINARYLELEEVAIEGQYSGIAIERTDYYHVFGWDDSGANGGDVDTVVSQSPRQPSHTYIHRINNTREEQYVGGLQYAVEMASRAARDSVRCLEVWVAGGTYTDYKGFVIRDSVTVKGGFPDVDTGCPGESERRPLLAKGIPLNDENSGYGRPYRRL